MYELTEARLGSLLDCLVHHGGAPWGAPPAELLLHSSRA